MKTIEIIPAWVFDVYGEELGTLDAWESYLEHPNEDELKEKFIKHTRNNIKYIVQETIMYLAMKSAGYSWIDDKDVNKAYKAVNVKQKLWYGFIHDLWEDIDDQNGYHLDGIFALLSELIITKKTYQEFEDAIRFCFQQEIWDAEKYLNNNNK